jgi:hypothetical protein
MTERDFLKIPNAGIKTLIEVKEALAQNGFHFGMLPAPFTLVEMMSEKCAGKRDRYSYEEWKQIRDDMRNILKLIKNPTRKMIDAGEGHLDALSTWRAMINAALED